MGNVLEQLAVCIERGKVNKDAKFPPDLQGQDGADELTVKALEQDKSIALVASKRAFIVEPSFLNIETKKWIEMYGDLQHKLNLSYKNGISYLDKTLFKSDEFFKSPLNKVGEPSTILFRKNHFSWSKRY